MYLQLKLLSLRAYHGQEQNHGPVSVHCLLEHITYMRETHIQIVRT